jgi:hypothetical protein
VCLWGCSRVFTWRKNGRHFDEAALDGMSEEMNNEFLFVLQTIAYSRRASDVRTGPVWITNATATMDTEAKAAQCQVTRLIHGRRLFLAQSERIITSCGHTNAKERLTVFGIICR